MSEQRSYKKNPHTRPALQNLNPIFRERQKSEDNQILSTKLVALARKSGNLNLSCRGLAYVPDKVYEINEADKDAKVSLDMLVAKEEEAWWNQIPLTNLDLSSNQLSQISSKIEKLCSLTVLSLHDNALKSIPKEICKLEKLTRINLSRNQLTELPEEFFTLPDLRYLNLSHNQFEELHPAISDLHMLDVLDVSNNNLVSLPCGIGFLVRVTQLLLSYNHLKELPSDMVSMRSLQKLELTHNDLVAIPENIGSLRKLQYLYLQHNDIKELPDFEGCNDLQELYASNNFLEKLPDNFCAKLSHLKILELRDNKINQLPDDIVLLQNLTRLDLTNNSICHLPNSLGHLVHLVSLQLEGNPIKSIRRDILQCGTVRILKTLRERSLADSNTNADKRKSLSNMGLDGLNSPRMPGSQNSDSTYPDKFAMRKNRCLAVNMQNLTKVPDEVFQNAMEANIMLIDFSKNRLTELPTGLTALKDVAQELVFANNMLVDIQPFIGDFSRLSLLNLSCNQLSNLPNEFGSLKTLRELNINNNRFDNIPNCVYRLTGLEILLAGDNKIKSIDATENGLGALKRLATLNLRNNNIEQVPPILGNLKNIITLEIIGNPFRLPRHQILVKGTEAIMSYLRDRIPA